MGIALLRNHGNAHPKRIAGDGATVVRERIERNIDFVVGPQICLVGTAESRAYDTRGCDAPASEFTHDTPRDLDVFERADEFFRGWMSADSLAIIAAVSRAQRDALGVVGSVGEIGVHEGRSFVALALSADLSRERLWACDVFEAQELNVDGSGLGDRELFSKNLASVEIDEKDVVVFNGSSLTVPPDFAEQACLARFRFLSVDGSHTRAATASDLRLAARALAPGGVVALDDVQNAGWPGVRNALNAMLAERPVPPLVVFATNHKAFLCAPADHARLLATTQLAFEVAGLGRLLRLEEPSAALPPPAWPVLHIDSKWDEPLATFEGMIRAAWDMPPRSVRRA